MTSNPLITVIDYGMGNLLSVEKALQAAGARVERTSDPARAEGASALCLPGVGAFGHAAKNLEDRGLMDPLRSFLKRGDRPFLGICLGYQLLFSQSQESPGARGLDVISGDVVKFQKAPRVPHMGWSPVDGVYYYFVHSYYPLFSQDPAGARILWAEYGERFAAGIRRGKLAAYQFHPEKSGAKGLALLRDFVATVSA